MVDRRFFDRKGPFALHDLARIGGAEVAELSDPEKSVIDVAPLDRAGIDELSFLDNPKYGAQFETSSAGACVIEAKYAAQAPAGMHLLLTGAPYLAYARIARAFYPEQPPEPGIAPSAAVDPEAVLGEGASVAPGAVVGRGAEIGAGSAIGANSVVAPGVVIGAGARIHVQVSLSHCLIGDRVVIHAGTRIGQDGFGFAPRRKGHVNIPQLGRVLIGDDVEIGANCAIDRGTGSDTVIGDGCRIDNLVQIGHNVVLGLGCIVAGQAGFAGSARLGDFVMVGGQVAVAGHLRIGDGAQIAGQSGVMADIPAGATYGGYPAVPIRDWHRQSVILRRMIRKQGKSR